MIRTHLGRLIAESLSESRASRTLKPSCVCVGVGGFTAPGDKRALWLDSDPAAIEAASAAMLDEGDVAVSLESWEFPCLLFVGTADVDFFEGAQRAAREIPHAEFIALLGLGHIGAHLARIPCWLPYSERCARLPERDCRRPRRSGPAPMGRQ